MLNTKTMVKVVFISKSGKINHFDAKDFSPISLFSFLFKGMEKILMSPYLSQNQSFKQWYLPWRDPSNRTNTIRRPSSILRGLL